MGATHPVVSELPPLFEECAGRVCLVDPVQADAYLTQAEANTDIAAQNALIIEDLQRERNLLIDAGRIAEQEARQLADDLQKAERENWVHRSLWFVLSTIAVAGAL